MRPASLSTFSLSLIPSSSPSPTFSLSISSSLIGEEVHLSGPLLCVLHSRAEGLTHLREPSHLLTQRAGLLLQPEEAVDYGDVGLPAQELLRFVLAVNVDQEPPKLLQPFGCYGAVVHQGPRSALGAR